MATLARTTARVCYYVRNVARDVVPQTLFRSRLAGLLERARHSGDTVRERLNYYNRLEQPFVPSPAAVPVSRIPFSKTMYYYDLKEFARYFDPGLLIDLKFGDVARVPKMPAIVKDRPIIEANSNAVLMKLDKFRHFNMPADPLRFSDKRPMVVWRGGLTNPIRAHFLKAVADSPLCDVGTPQAGAPEQFRKPFLSIQQQKQYRYIVSLEGHDVATNLKWIMSSNSLCLMPLPTYETWFAEARIEANTHYVPLERDFSDLTDKVAYFERHPAEAQRITAAANAYCRRFHDEEEERLVSLLVLYKYFVLSGQIKPDTEVWRYIAG